jgi:hypothetical protein
MLSCAQDQARKAMNGEAGVYACEFEENFYKQPALVQPWEEPEPYRMNDVSGYISLNRSNCF